MSRVQRLASLCVWLLVAGAIVSLPASASPVPEGAKARRNALEIRTTAWVLPTRRLEITLEQRGVLAGRHLGVYLFIDTDQFERITTKADRTQLVIRTPTLAPGSHVLTARSGQEVARTEFRVLAWSWVFSAAALLLVFGGGLGLAIARRRRGDPRDPRDPLNPIAGQ